MGFLIIMIGIVFMAMAFKVLLSAGSNQKVWIVSSTFVLGVIAVVYGAMVVIATL